jgi:uncharacterized protein (DUF2235 family)
MTNGRDFGSFSFYLRMYFKPDTREHSEDTMPRKGGYRHLIYFIDGTWLWAGSDKSLDVYSNIYRFNLLLDADDTEGRAQIVHYTRGLGAVSGTRQYSAGGFANGIDELVADLYVNICSNYERGDKLYLFGFSRGAVVARALTGLLSHGILEAHHINMFAHVWAAYTGQGDVLLPGQPPGTAAKEPAIDYTSFCSDRSPPIEFVGVFDTVSGGNGITEIAQKLRLSARKVQPNVKHALQLLAIDETRSFFKPVLWTGLGDSEKRLRYRRTLEQIWMPGVHSDVGGAYSKRHLGNLALITMIDRAIARTTLSFDLRQCRNVRVFADKGDLVRIHDEFTRSWNLFSGSQARKIEADIPQSLHPFAKHLVGKPVAYKGNRKSTIYTLPPQFSALPVAEEFLSDNFRSNCA